MALRDLFKSKSGKRRLDPRIRWFGKLPSYPDYYNSRADEDWSVEFNDWVLKGYELYRGRRAEAASRNSKLPVSGCMVRLPKSGMTVFASILDFGGDMRGRPFPICFYAGVPTDIWPGPTSDRIVPAARAVRDLLAIRLEVPRFLNSPGRFDMVFGRREVNLEGVDDATGNDSWMQEAGKIGFLDWFEVVKAGMKTTCARTWLALVDVWGANLSQHDGKSFEPTLRFPLAMRMPLDAQIAGWVRWLEGRMELKRRAVSLLVSGEPGEALGHLIVIARALMPDDFLLITPVADTLSYLDDLSGIREPDNDAEQAGSVHPSGESSFDVSGSWREFVSRPVTKT